jgi:hypothetical protein
MVTMDTQKTSFLLRSEVGCHYPAAAIPRAALSVTSSALVASRATTEGADVGTWPENRASLRVE